MPEKDGIAWPGEWPDDIRYLARNEWSNDVVSEEVRAFYMPKAAFSLPAASCIQTHDNLIPSASITTATKDDSDDDSDSEIPVLHPASHVQGPCPLVEPFIVRDKSHPAYGERGLRAVETLAPDSFVLNYIGQICTDCKPLPGSSGDYVLHMDRGINIDSEFAGNEGRFINDFRGVTSRPSVAFDTYRHAVTGEVQIGVFVLGKPIQVGEELVTTYGADYWASRGMVSSEPDWNEGWG